MPRSPFRFCLAILLAGLSCAPAARAAEGQATVAVFNFQLRQGEDQWRWLEKFLADQVMTDLALSGRLQVVARDRMQQVAEQLNWAPEMAQRDAPMAQIADRLKIAYVVTGVCSVQGDQVLITGQVVAIDDRREHFRTTVGGKASEVLALQKQLSARMVAWFTRRPAEQVLEQLPVWTRSLPAARALYQGIDLYDRGLYGEAWLRFRSAARSDPEYIEAFYWTGRMYYFLGRYRHARLALERFLQLETPHPRLGDAIREFLDTCEQLDAEPALLLKLYEELRRRWPKVIVRDDSQEIPADLWLRHRAARVLAAMGRHAQAVAMAGPAFRFLSGPRSTWQIQMQELSLQSALACHDLNGRTPPTKLLVDSMEDFAARNFFLRFDPGETQKVHRPAKDALRLAGTEHRARGAGNVPLPTQCESHFLLVAPDGHVFQSLRLVPECTGDDAVIEAAVGPADLPGQTFGPPRSADYARARRDGLTFSSLPTAGMLRVDVRCRVSNEQTSGPTALEAVRVEAAFRKVPVHGALRVQCATTADYRVEVDGRPGRYGDGLIGMLTPGEHTLTLRATDPDSPFADRQMAARVEANRTVDVFGQLGWKDPSPWSKWTACPIPIGGDGGPDPDAGSWSLPSAPSLLVDQDKTRMVWTRGRDLWAVTSTDGQRFDEPQRLPPPVTTAWNESRPRCIRDESGRYVLVFISDRDARHTPAPYLTWSRDFEHWSVPVRITDQDMGVAAFDLIQDVRGRYLLVTGRPGFRYDNLYRFDLAMWISTDGRRWEPRPRFLSCHLAHGVRPMVRIVQRRDGSYALVTATVSDDWRSRRTATRVMLATSLDLVDWQWQPDIAEIPGAVTSMSVIWPGESGRILLVQPAGSDAAQPAGGVVLLIQDQEGQWQISRTAAGLADGAQAELSLGPGKGSFFAWMSDPAGHRAGPPRLLGPYVLRGPGLEDFLAEARPVTPPPPRHTVQAAADQRPPGRSIGGTVYRPRPDGEPAALLSRPLQTAGDRDFTAAGANAGVRWPAARVAWLAAGSTRFGVALDKTSDDFAVPNILRWDLKGNGDFHKAPVIELSHATGETAGDKERTCRYEASVLQIPWKGRTVPVSHVLGSYIQSAGNRKVSLSFQFFAEAYCRFAGKLQRVCIVDGNHNLELTDVLQPALVDGLPDALPPGGGDTLSVGTQAERYPLKGFYGHPLLLDGALWNVTLSEDGRQVTVEPYNGPAGTVRVNSAAWSCWLIGRKNVLFVQGNRDSVPVPADTYLVWGMQQRSQASGQIRWKGDLTGLPTSGLAEGRKPVTVKESSTVDLATDRR